MATLEINKSIIIGEDKPCFIIAEIGQNHQGDINVAKELIQMAKEAGADCVKFQKTCLKEKFTKSVLFYPYISSNSFGFTYGGHKEYLEFREDQIIELQKYALELNILFSVTAMDEISLKFLSRLNLPFIKIGSGDATNYPLLHKAALLDQPLLISTGMSDFEQVQQIHTIVSKYHNNFALLHCISAYPTPFNEINMNVVNTYKTAFPNTVIGYSGHEIGFAPTLASVSLGCKIVERHLTLCKEEKGSDHKCSLEPDEFKCLVRSIREIEMALGKSVKSFQPSERICYNKLGKSIVAKRNLLPNSKLSLDHLAIKVALPKGIDACRIYDFVGKYLKREVKEDQAVQKDDVQMT